MVAQLCGSTENHSVIRCTWMDYMVRELYLNKALKSKTKQLHPGPLQRQPLRKEWSGKEGQSDQDTSGRGGGIRVKPERSEKMRFLGICGEVSAEGTMGTKASWTEA